MLAMPRPSHSPRRRPPLAVLAAVATLAAAWPAKTTLACSLAPQPPHTLDPQAQATDTVAPAAPELSLGDIRRGKDPDTDYSSCSQSATSCDDLGSIALQVSARDDQTTADHMGYTFEVTAGQPPSNLYLPSGAVRTRAGNVYLYWNDGATDDEETIDFTLAVHAVDLAGNTGPAATLRVQHPGSGGGCAVLPCRPLSSWPIPLLLFLLIRSARERRSRSRQKGILPASAHLPPLPGLRAPSLRTFRARAASTQVESQVDMALRRRCPEAGLLHHSDRGSPYASEDYQDLLTANGIVCTTLRLHRGLLQPTTPTFGD